MKNKIDDDRAFELYMHGSSDSEIAKEFSVCTTSVKHWRKRNGLPANYLLMSIDDDRLLRDPESLLHNKGFLDQLLSKPVVMVTP